VSSTVVITRNKVSVGVVEPSTLRIDFDLNMSGGTTARAEVAPDVGFLEPDLFSLRTDPEVRCEVWALVDGSATEQRLYSLDENSYRDVDVTEEFGELILRRLVLVGVTKTTTTALRSIILNYSGRLVDFR
jgi:hypothetical protein